MKCLNCNVVILGNKLSIEHELEGHVVLTINQAHDFWTTANKLNLLTEEQKIRITHGGPVPLGGSNEL